MYIIKIIDCFFGIICVFVQSEHIIVDFVKIRDKNVAEINHIMVPVNYRTFGRFVFNRKI